MMTGAELDEEDLSLLGEDEVVGVGDVEGLAVDGVHHLGSPTTCTRHQPTLQQLRIIYNEYVLLIYIIIKPRVFNIEFFFF
jgi:hypothetical protein